jgi:hypothetical protein
MAIEKKSSNSMFTKEEELLLQDFNRNVSTGGNVLFYGSAFIISACQICKFTISTSSIEILLIIYIINWI